MDRSPHFYNWSLSKALDTIPDSFAKARLKIIFTIVIFAIFKALIVLGIAGANGQSRQVIRAVIAVAVYSLLLKIVLGRPHWVKGVAHAMLSAGVLLVCSGIFLYTSSINLATTQFVFMIVLSSFYTLGTRWGIVYSVAGIAPLLLVLATGSSNAWLIVNSQDLASPGPQIIILLNFVSMVLVHFLFYRAFQKNIEEKEKLNEQLQVSILEATKLAASKTNFLSTMSHELRTPLNSVIGMSELLIQNNPDKAQHENLQILQSASQDLLALINNILDLNKTDADQLKLEAVPFRLAELIRSKCSGLQVRAHDKGLSFVMDIDPRLERTVTVSDPTRLSQVIYNLVSNAIKFTDQGSIHVQLECTDKTPDNIQVEFAVTDTGIGVSPEKHDRIFELFTQAEAYTTRTYGGTGLGLAIVKQLLLLFNSRIQLESAPGEGSRFSFVISFATTDDAPERETATRAPATFGHLKILVAEDNPMNRLILARQMEKLEVSPVIVENGAEAYQAYLSDTFDAVFLDLHMPVQDGYETIAQIRTLSQAGRGTVPIIAFTASITEQEKIAEAGFDDYLHKPASMNDLHQKLEKIAGIKERVG